MLKNITLENICYSCRSFKHYKNIIVHYTGSDASSFIITLSEILSCIVIDFYEKDIINRMIFKNYFYFNAQEAETVFDISLELLQDKESVSYEDRLKILVDTFYDYLCVNKKIILDGFINFRLFDYVALLENVIDDAVNKFIVEREYWEFISLLRIYVNSEDSLYNCVHLFYSGDSVTLLDENLCIIDTKSDNFNAKYLSDISFSSNDFALNTLLNILPKKIFLHLESNKIDEFVNTVLLIFENRVEVCNLPIGVKNFATWDSFD